MDYLDGEVTEITLASVLPEFPFDDEGIKQRLGNTLPIDTHVPLVRAARFVDAAHLVVVVNCTHVLVVLVDSRGIVDHDRLSLLVVASDRQAVTFSHVDVRQEVDRLLVTPPRRKDTGVCTLHPLGLPLRALSSHFQVFRKACPVRHDSSAAREVYKPQPV